jgi:hypothetical protein
VSSSRCPRQGTIAGKQHTISADAGNADQDQGEADHAYASEPLPESHPADESHEERHGARQKRTDLRRWGELHAGGNDEEERCA